MGSEEMVRKSNKTVRVSDDGKRTRKTKTKQKQKPLPSGQSSRAGCVMLQELKEYNFTTQIHNILSPWFIVTSPTYSPAL